MNRRTAVPLIYAVLAAGAFMIGSWVGLVVFVGTVLTLGSIAALAITLLQPRSAPRLPFHRRFVSNFGKAMRAILPTLP